MKKYVHWDKEKENKVERGNKNENKNKNKKIKSKKGKKSSKKGWLFLLIAVIVYIVVALINKTIAQNSLFTFVKILVRVTPVLVVVFGLMVISHLILSPKRVMKYLGSTAGVKGWLISIGGGIISTGPIYMWYPLLQDLKEKGMKTSFIAAFLYNRAIKLPLLPLMVYYFGLPFTVILTVYMMIFSVIHGVFVEMVLQ